MMKNETFKNHHDHCGTDHAALARWVYSLNELMKNILSDLKDEPDEEDFDRASFDQSFEQDLHGLLMQCPADPFALNVDSRSINPYLSAFINSLGEEVVDQDVDHFQLVNPSLLLDSVRHHLDSSEMGKAKINLKRNEKETSESLFQYILGLKAVYSKLMIIRLDLFTQDCLGSLRDWERLRKYVSDRYMGSYVGYAVKFEYGRQRGVHMHTVLFFDGSVVRQDVTIAKAIGEHWKDSVTAGGGTYGNCNTLEHRKNMRYPAVGTFHQFDELNLKGLRHIANYLTQQDLAVRFAVPGLVHTLRRGNINKKKRSLMEKRAKRHVSSLVREAKMMVPKP